MVYSRVELSPSGSGFNATTVSLSTLGGLSRKLFATALIQYDNFTRNLQANVRVDWIHRPGSDLFLVFNTAYHFTGGYDNIIWDPHRDVAMLSRVGIAKLTYLILL